MIEESSVSKPNDEKYETINIKVKITLFFPKTILKFGCSS